MTRIQELVEERLGDEDEDLAEFLSEGEGEDWDALEEPIIFDESFPSTIFICNVPKVGKAKYDKLIGVLNRLIDKFGPNDKHMPMNESGEMTEGVVLVTFESADSAKSACTALDGMALDKSHTFKVLMMDAFDEIVSRNEEFEAQRTLSSFSRADFRQWLADEKCREQILLRYQTETEICWHDTMAGQPVLCYGGEREKQGKKIWCDWRVQWSPYGSYLATFHQPGIALWADSEFHKKVRFAHESVKYIQFSPTEDHLLTWNGALSTEPDDNAVRIFRVLTGECVRKCRTPAVAPLGGEFPHFLWSNDGKFFAECNESSISVRDTETFELIKDEEGKKKTLKFDSLHTFQWSPKDNVIAVWTLEKNNNPARLVLVEIPSRRELASRSRTQVEASMYWQSEGDYLCLLVTKLSKTKKKGTTNLEIFRIRDKNIPVDIVEVRDTVRGFYWETKGNRFAVLTTDDAGHHPKLLIFMLGSAKCEQICSFDLPSNSFNDFYWAPDGQYFVCCAIGHGDLLFGGLTADNKLEILYKDEHFMLTEVSWDPSSRYVITAVTQPMQNEMGGFKYSMEAGYAIWTFQGRKLYQQQKEKLWQIAWRPHPPSLLGKNRQQDIRKNIKQFSKKYDALDEQAKDAARRAFQADRQEKTDAFKKILDRLDDFRKDTMADNGWDEAWESHLESQGWEVDEKTVEEELSKDEELISG
eukprot:CAMPEP_0197892808 /NCGR_PEP_ID=MMETSP1439-20131203/31653_1 /TAXON_ID=66791 /ORGANISM="Gonyaulax spinifera, Strain CCMP409" /LENGTH=699 /DNA_ID=CAMNT_0043513017 /DNA_START=57 /DNA_END=2156 /DNA_ORIENTATION=-